MTVTKVYRRHNPYAVLQDRERCLGLLACLTTREAQVIVRLYGLAGTPEHTHRSAAADMGLSRARIQQLEVRALQKMRREAGARAPP